MNGIPVRSIVSIESYSVYVRPVVGGDGLGMLLMVQATVMVTPDVKTKVSVVPFAVYDIV